MVLDKAMDTVIVRHETLLNPIGRTWLKQALSMAVESWTATVVAEWWL